MPKPVRKSNPPASLSEFRKLQKRSTDPRLKDVVRMMGDNYFELGLILSGVALMSPVGAIPGLPLICAIFLTGISFSFLIKSRQLLLPKTVEKFKISRTKLRQAADMTGRVNKKITHLFRPRIEILTGVKAKTLMAVLVLAVALSILFLGIVPFGVFIPGLMLALAGLGFLKNDGLLIAIVFAIPFVALISLTAVYL